MGKEHKDPIYQHGSKRGYSFIRYAGLYDFKGILKDSKSKLESEKYDIYDKQHDEKISSSGKDMKIVLQGSKEVTEYVKFEMEITIIIMGQIDVMVNKKRVQKGNLEFRVMSKMSKNHSGYHKTSVFKKSTLGNILKNFYEKFIIQEELSDREDVLFDHGKDLLDAIRKRLL
ncbi:hypothetical protein HOM13_02790 [Candidatus Woesearchaeota archaeon]|jgi:hypothetical protein|nr:hypothetical protein [Candidatus Woesearchaeota archaeon]MBT5215638.1 hypothetical protein [Candidatus Woesearchaeota archaeon]MBT6402461.1 hypothetical protein [Candidatus Woesearchaeota archaeon]